MSVVIFIISNKCNRNEAHLDISQLVPDEISTVIKLKTWDDKLRVLSTKKDFLPIRESNSLENLTEMDAIEFMLLKFD